jgi:L-cysteine desulfidase
MGGITMHQEKLVELLKAQMRPALGVTEVGAIALACARARALTEGAIQKIRVTLNKGMYKNAFSCSIPGTREMGNEIAAALGAVAGNWEQGLQALEGITQSQIEEAKGLLKQGIVEVEINEKEDALYICAEVITENHTGVAVIKNTHDHIILLEHNGEIIWQDQQESQQEEEFPFDSLTIEEMYRFVTTVEAEKIAFLADMVTMNLALAKEGAKGAGLKISQSIKAYQKEGFLAQDMVSKAQELTCDAMDARLAGLPFPAMSITGSGSHGIVCSLPIVAYAKEKGCSDEELYRALALSALFTIYSKHYTGRLSPLCGCILGGGTGACVGLVYLMGGKVQEIGYAICHMAANLTGMICDGGNLGCALKAASGVQAAYLSAMLAMKGVEIPPYSGIVGATPEETVKHMGRISLEGMRHTDEVLMDIMQNTK